VTADFSLQTKDEQKNRARSLNNKVKNDEPTK
jgi:hypothetical protein